MVFFATLIALAHRLRPADAPRAPPGRRALVGAAAAAAYVQIVLGALVRHTGAGLACNTAIPLCDGAWWPEGGAAQLHMAHRYAGVALVFLVAAAAAGPARSALREGRRLRALLALAAPALVAIQIALGLATVATFISIPLVTAHLAAGALLLADLFALFLSLGPRRAAAPGAALPAAVAPAAG
jgi:cytochrome c oxidase assembly protein subunit 15